MVQIPPDDRPFPSPLLPLGSLVVYLALTRWKRGYPLGDQPLAERAWKFIFTSLSGPQGEEGATGAPQQTLGVS